MLTKDSRGTFYDSLIFNFPLDLIEVYFLITSVLKA